MGVWHCFFSADLNLYHLLLIFNSEHHTGTWSDQWGSDWPVADILVDVEPSVSSGCDRLSAALSASLSALFQEKVLQLGGLFHVGGSEWWNLRVRKHIFYQKPHTHTRTHTHKDSVCACVCVCVRVPSPTSSSYFFFVEDSVGVEEELVTTATCLHPLQNLGLVFIVCSCGNTNWGLNRFQNTDSHNPQISWEEVLSEGGAVVLWATAPEPPVWVRGRGAASSFIAIWLFLPFLLTLDPVQLTGMSWTGPALSSIGGLRVLVFFLNFIEDASGSAILHLRIRGPSQAPAG